MKRLPSVKTLSIVFGDRAKEARELLEKKRKTTEYDSVKKWIDACYNKPSYTERLLCALNEIAGTHGVECIFGNGQYWPDFEYLNMGDAYVATLIYSRKTGSFSVGCWGDIVERANGRYG